MQYVRYPRFLPFPQTIASPAPTPAPVEECYQCEDVPAPFMIDRGELCTDERYTNKMGPGNKQRYCTANNGWKKSKFCELQCFLQGAPYDDSNCCPPPTPEPVSPTPPPTDPPTDGFPCEDITPGFMSKKNNLCTDTQYVVNMQTKWCNQNNKWVENYYCARTCYLLGFGYDDVDCSNAPAPTQEPTDEVSCSDDPANWMKKQGKECDDESIRSDLLSKWCNKNNQWNNKQFCSLSCARLGVGYEGLDCGDIPTLEPVEEPQQECSDDPAGWMKKQEKACTDVDESEMRSQ